MINLNLKKEKQIEIELISYLSQCDFPENCLYKTENQDLNCDVVACDKNYLKEVALFECKTKIDKNSLARLVNNYQLVFSKLKNKVTYHVVLPGDDVWPFHIYDISDFVNGNAEVNMNDFEAMHMAMPTREYIIPGEVKRKEKKNQFQKLCEAYAVFLLILFLLNCFDYYQFTKERLIFLAMIIITSFLPFIDVIKYKDFSLFLKDDNKEK